MAGFFLTNGGTADLISLTTDSAAALDILASYADNASGSFSEGRQVTQMSSATTTTILSGPASSTIRNLKTANVRNNDASLTVNVTVNYNVSATLYTVFKTLLNPGDVLTYTENLGWFVYSAVAKLDAKRYVTSDVVFATAATFADVTGLTVPVVSGLKYNFEAHLYHISNATTTGAQFGVNGPSMTNLLIATIDTVTASVTASVHSAGSATAVNTAATAQSTGSAGVTLGILSGGFEPSASGTFAIRGTSEVTVAAGLTVKRGSWCRVWQTDN
jgi:hypothetical protein